MRDRDADFFGIAGDTNIKSFHLARSLLPEPAWSLHVSPRHKIDDFVFAWGGRSTTDVESLPTDLRDQAHTPDGERRVARVVGERG